MAKSIAHSRHGVGAKGAAKAERVMGEFKRGSLRSGSATGPKVTERSQAKAIALSEARRVARARPR